MVIKKYHTIELIKLVSKMGGYAKIFSFKNYSKIITDALKKTEKKIIKGISLNINCIRNKLPELGVLIDKIEPNILCIQETLKNSNWKKIRIQQYQVVELKQSNGKSRRGHLIVIRNVNKWEIEQILSG